MHPTNTIFENQIAKKAPLKRDLLGAYRDSNAFSNLHLKYSIFSTIAHTNTLNRSNLLAQLLLCFRFELSIHATRVARPMGHSLRDAVKRSAGDL